MSTKQPRLIERFEAPFGAGSVATSSQPGDLLIIVTVALQGATPASISGADLLEVNVSAGMRVYLWAIQVDSVNQAYQKTSGRGYHFLYRSDQTLAYSRARDRQLEVSSDGTLVSFAYMRSTGLHQLVEIEPPDGSRLVYLDREDATDTLWFAAAERRFSATRQRSTYDYQFSPPAQIQENQVRGVFIHASETRDTAVQLIGTGRSGDSLPGGIQNGDLVLVGYQMPWNTPPALPAGWTTAIADSSTSGIYWQTYDSGTPIDFGFATGFDPEFSLINEATWVFSVWRNVHPVFPVQFGIAGDRTIDGPSTINSDPAKVRHLGGVQYYHGAVKSSNSTVVLPSGSVELEKYELDQVAFASGYRLNPRSGFVDAVQFGNQNPGFVSFSALIRPTDEHSAEGQTEVRFLSGVETRESNQTSGATTEPTPAILSGSDALVKIGARGENGWLIQPDAIYSKREIESVTLTDEQKLSASPKVVDTYGLGTELFSAIESEQRKSWSYRQPSLITLLDDSVVQSNRAIETANSIEIAVAGRSGAVQDWSGDPVEILIDQQNVISVSFAKDFIDEQRLVATPTVTTPLPGEIRQTLFQLASAEATFQNQLAGINPCVLSASGRGGINLNFADPFEYRVIPNGVASIRPKYAEASGLTVNMLADHTRRQISTDQNHLVVTEFGKTVAFSNCRLDWKSPWPANRLYRSLIVCQLEFDEETPIDDITLKDEDGVPVPYFVRSQEGARLKLILQPYYTPNEKPPIFLSIRELVQ